MEGLIQPYFTWRTQQLLADGVLTVSVDGVTRHHRRFARRMVARTQELLAIQLVRVKGPADIRFRSASSGQLLSLTSGRSSTGVANYAPDGSWDVATGRWLPRPMARMLLIHEFGHALGLEHPFDDHDGDALGELDTDATVMAYRPGRKRRAWWRPMDRDALTGLWGRRGSVPSAQIAAA